MAGEGRAVPIAFSTLNHAPMFGAGPALGDQVRAAHDAGFDAVSVDIFSVRAEREARGDQGLASIAALGLPVLDIAALSVGTDPVGPALDEARRFADALRPAWVLVKLDGATTGVVLEHLHAVATGLAEIGVRVAVEPSPLGVVPTLATGASVLADADVLATGAALVLDTWHFFVGADGWEALASVPFEHVAYLQLADGRLPEHDDLMAATLHERELPGAGAFDLGRLVDVIGAAGWRGPVCGEILSAAWRDGDVAAFAAEVLDACRALAARLADSPRSGAGELMRHG